jgi:hypothetical protein
MVCSKHPSYAHVARLEHADSGRAPVVVMIETTHLGSGHRRWERRLPAGRTRLADQFISTSVAITCLRLKVRAMVSVHPHERGEHYIRDVRNQMDADSSTQAWGTRTVHTST